VRAVRVIEVLEAAGREQTCAQTSLIPRATFRPRPVPPPGRGCAPANEAPGSGVSTPSFGMQPRGWGPAVGRCAALASCAAPECPVRRSCPQREAPADPRPRARRARPHRSFSPCYDKSTQFDANPRNSIDRFRATAPTPSRGGVLMSIDRHDNGLRRAQAARVSKISGDSENVGPRRAQGAEKPRAMDRTWPPPFVMKSSFD